MEDLIYEYERLYKKGKAMHNSHADYRRMEAILKELNSKYRVSMRLFAGLVNFIEIDNIQHVYSFE